jgi:hypothetical protein
LARTVFVCRFSSYLTICIINKIVKIIIYLFLEKILYPAFIEINQRNLFISKEI